jgi:uncharacterized membrane protein required for colicin V production
MNWLDIAVAVALAAFALRGFLKGLVAESLGFLGLLLAVAAGLFAHPPVADLLRRVTGLARPVAVLAAAIFVFLLAEFVWLFGMWFFLGRAKRQSFRRSGANRLGGALFGLGKGVVWVGLALLFLEAVPMPRLYRSAAEAASVAGRVRAVAPWIGEQAAALLPRPVQRRYETFRGQVAQLGARWRVISPPGPGPQPPATPAAPSKAPPAKTHT